ncbi:MAG: hypothetical protein ONB46_26465 [candidate division KSB1 bacterium]|nr:hypothetical protein [candidate division KSB1 bacterium]MDZ7407587.1 hypothetical protein [candidate division KSB1 bacterium]
MMMELTTPAVIGISGLNFVAAVLYSSVGHGGAPGSLVLQLRVQSVEKDLKNKNRRTQSILVKGHFYSVMASVSQRSNPLKIKRDCFGTKRLAMTPVLTLNKYISPPAAIETAAGFRFWPGRRK